MSLASLHRRRLTVIANERLGAYTLLCMADPDGPVPGAGQFTMLATVARWGGGADERPYLARAFSVARCKDGEAQYLLEDVGPASRRLCELRAGEQVWALGPLGRGFTPPAEGRRALLVGGGIGVAPLLILQDALRDGSGRWAARDAGGRSRGTLASGEHPRFGQRTAPAERYVVVLLGFRDRERAACAVLFDDPQMAVDDGSAGHRGFVTELLEAELRRDAHAVVYACGPAAMLEGVRAICAREHVPAQLALEAGMACGFGACYGCAVPRRGGGYLRVCLDGPVIDAAALERVEEHAGALE